MIQKLLNKEIQEYIHANLHSDLHALLLKKSPFPEVSIQEIVQQIKGRKVAEKKFPLLNQDKVFFPPNLNLEQASSQDTAAFKSQFFKGKKFIDLTSGFGIDAFFLSENFDEITLVEQNAELLEIVQHNWEILGKKATFIHQKLEDFLNDNEGHFDLIYLDPARRDGHNRKVFLLEELTPNILEIQEKLLKVGKDILIKLSPLIDLQHLFQSLNQVHQIWIIAVKNEVKEVLVHLKSSVEKPQIRCINLQDTVQEFNFSLDDLNRYKTEYCVPNKYFYLPNNAILKSGAFDLIAQRFSLQKLHPNTHCYTQEKLIQNFPGRIFEIETIEAKAIQKKGQYNLISKNYPLKPEEIKKKYQLKDGGNQYLIFTQSIEGKHILKGNLLPV